MRNNGYYKFEKLLKTSQLNCKLLFRRLYTFSLRWHNQGVQTSMQVDTEGKQTFLSQQSYTHLPGVVQPCSKAVEDVLRRCMQPLWPAEQPLGTCR